MKASHCHIADAKNYGSRADHDAYIHFSHAGGYHRERQCRADGEQHPIKCKFAHFKAQILTYRRVKYTGTVVDKSKTCALKDTAADQNKPCIMYLLFIFHFYFLLLSMRVFPGQVSEFARHTHFLQ